MGWMGRSTLEGYSKKPSILLDIGAPGNFMNAVSVINLVACGFILPKGAAST